MLGMLKRVRTFGEEKQIKVRKYEENKISYKYLL